MMKRTKARLKINQILTGKKTNLRVVGCLLFREWSEKDKRFYYWEEWEITGLADYDTWVEYDHSDEVVSLYEPIRFTRSIDPQQLKKGQSFTLSEQDGTDHVVVVDEVGVGEIVNIKGKNTYQVFPKEMMAYATLRDSKAPKGRQLITIEKYNNREYCLLLLLLYLHFWIIAPAMGIVAKRAVFMAAVVADLESRIF